MDGALLSCSLRMVTVDLVGETFGERFDCLMCRGETLAELMLLRRGRVGDTRSRIRIGDIFRGLIYL